MISGRTAGEIAFSIRKSVEDGRLTHGQPLPPIRDLADDLGVNRNTVAAAYKSLSDAGLIRGKGRQGSRINLRERRVASRSDSYKELSGGNPDPNLLPDVQSLFEGCTWAQHRYEDAPDDPDLVELMRQRWISDGLPVGTVWMSSGTFDAVANIFRQFLKQGDKVAVEDPCFMTALGLIRQCGYEPVAMPVDDEGVTAEGLERALKAGAAAVIVTPRAHNPFGGSWSAKRHAALLAVMQRYPNVILIEDDHFSVLSDYPAISLVEPDRKHWASIRSVSKYLGPDLRVAAVNSSESVSRACLLQNAFSSRWVSGFLQTATVNLLKGSAFEDLTQRAAQAYRSRREAVQNALAQRGIKAYGRDGIHVWIPVADEASTVRKLYENGWSVRPGSLFRIQSGPGIRVTTSALEADQAAEFADALSYALRYEQVERGA